MTRQAWVWPLAVAVAMARPTSGWAQRRSVGGQGGLAARIVYREHFEEDTGGFVATGYGSVRFLKATMPDVEAKATPEKFSVLHHSGGVFDSRGCLAIVAEAGAAFGCAERYFDWEGADPIIVFNYLADGVENAYVQAWGYQAEKNLHEYIKIEQQGSWGMAKIAASSMVGWRGGAWAPGEKFGNLMFVVETGRTGVSRPRFLIDQLVILDGRDGQPPSKPPTSVKAEDTGEGIVLSWEPAQDDVGVFLYEVYRHTEPGVELKARHRVESCAALTWRDRDVEAQRVYYYRVVAVDAGGNRVASEEVSARCSRGATPAPPKQALEF